MTATLDGITMDDGVIVHDHLICHGDNTGWWAYRGGSILFGADQDALLLEIGRAAGFDETLEELRGRLARSIERSEQMRAQDALLAVRMGNMPPGANRCHRCGGMGTVTEGVSTVTCPVCNGKGYNK